MKSREVKVGQVRVGRGCSYTSHARPSRGEGNNLKGGIISKALIGRIGAHYSSKGGHRTIK